MSQKLASVYGGHTLESNEGRHLDSGVSDNDLWLLRFGAALREAVARFTAWLANDFPPWAAHRGLMSGRLIALDKCPGVRPIGIGETWRRLCAKALLPVAGPEAKQPSGVDQLCAGLEARIEGAIHHMIMCGTRIT